MLSILHKGLEPNEILYDPITFLTSTSYLSSFAIDNNVVTVEKLSELLTSKKHRLQGLLVLKIALEQNPVVHSRGHWNKTLSQILNDSENSTVKEHTCIVFCMILETMGKCLEESRSKTYAEEMNKFCKDVLPNLLIQIDQNAQWSIAALKCVLTCLKWADIKYLSSSKDLLLTVIFKKISHCISSEMFELIAECFCCLPNLTRTQPSAEMFIEEWNQQYLTTLNTTVQLLKGFSHFFLNDTMMDASYIIDSGVYDFQDDEAEDSDAVKVHLKAARRYINLSRCIAKMLSTPTRFPVNVPVKVTLFAFTQLFQMQHLQNVKPSTSAELQILCSVLSQMQVASLLVLEALVLNFNVLPHSLMIARWMKLALRCSKMTSISVEPISQIRHTVWKFLKIFLKKYGGKISTDIINLQGVIVLELLNDISVEEKKSEETNVSQATSKSNSEKKCSFKEDRPKICQEALEVLEQLIYTGSCYFSKKTFQEIFNKVLLIGATVNSSPACPLPYTDEICRKNLYSVLLALTMVSSLENSDLIQCAIGLMRRGFQDTSYEINGLCNRAMTMISARIHPRRPPMNYRLSSEKQRPSKTSSAIVKYSDWTSEEYVHNIPIETVPNVHENADPRIAHQFHNINENAIHEEEAMEEDLEAMEEEPRFEMCYVPNKFADQGAKNHHNGDDVLETEHSSQGQDEAESDEDEEEDEEEDEDEEEIQQVDENMYIPSTSKLQVLNPVHMNPETAPQSVSEPEFEQLRPCVVKAEDSKNTHLNGVHSIVCDADVPSSSAQQSLANENGLYDEEEDVEEEEEDCDEDEEEESIPFPGEKRVTDIYPQNIAYKKIKLEIDEPKSDPIDDETPRSPTLTEMKADFCISETDEVKS